MMHIMKVLGCWIANESEERVSAGVKK